MYYSDKILFFLSNQINLFSIFITLINKPEWKSLIYGNQF